MKAKAKVTNRKCGILEGDDVDVIKIRMCDKSGCCIMYFKNQYGRHWIVHYQSLMQLQSHWNIDGKFDLEHQECDKHCIMFDECG